MSASEPEPGISPTEAKNWWRTHEPLGALLDKLMLLFIGVPIALVIKESFVASAIVFAFIVPYGFLVRYLAVVVVRRRIARDPESLKEFRSMGVVTTTDNAGDEKSSPGASRSVL